MHRVLRIRVIDTEQKGANRQAAAARERHRRAQPRPASRAKCRRKTVLGQDEKRSGVASHGVGWCCFVDTARVFGWFGQISSRGFTGRLWPDRTRRVNRFPQKRKRPPGQPSGRKASNVRWDRSSCFAVSIGLFAAVRSLGIGACGNTELVGCGSAGMLALASARPNGG